MSIVSETVIALSSEERTSRILSAFMPGWFSVAHMMDIPNHLFGHLFRHLFGQRNRRQ